MNGNKAKLQLLKAKLSKADEQQIDLLAKNVADHMLANTKIENKELRNVFAELAVEIAALSRRMDEAQTGSATDFDTVFGKLSESLDKDVVASLSDSQIAVLAESLGAKLSETVSSLNMELARRDLADTVEVKGLDKMLTKLVDKIPSSIDGKVTLAYNRSAAKDYLNVRLTDGQAFIDSMVGAARGVGLPLIKTSGGIMALPVVNPDGSSIGGGSGGSSDPRTGYAFSNTATVSTVDYVGYVNKDGLWYVMKVDANGKAEYATGVDGDYDFDNFTAWAPTEDYGTFAEAF